ncbi:MAG: acyl-CoA dehydrogenase family protein [Acidimicrobiales bacterium]
MSDREALRAEVEAALEGLLRRRDPNAKKTVMGAGADDVEPGRRYLAALAPGGWYVPTWPTEYGGRGARRDEVAAIQEALRGYETPDMYPFLVGIGLVGPAVRDMGAPEQCQRWLPSIANGSTIWCQLFSEPDAGSDLANLATRAERDGDIWRVNGQKVWSSRAHYSDMGILLARTNLDVPKHAGITAFAIDMHQPGVEVRPLVQINGDKHFNEVFLNDAIVRDEDRIGDVGQGWAVAIAVLGYERASVGGGGGGAGAEGGGTFARLTSMARTNGLAADPAFRQRLADLYTANQASRWTAQRARDATKSGGRPGPEGSGGKVRLTYTLQTTGRLAKAGQGAAGMLSGDEWDTIFLTGPSMSIRGGTDEIQRNILGERVLGLPPEPRLDKDVPFNQVRRTGVPGAGG